MGRSVFTDEYALVVECLIKLRHDKRLHQADLAARLGKDQQFVSRVENRLRRLDVIEFYAYVRALGADPKDTILNLFDRLPEKFGDEGRGTPRG